MKSHAMLSALFAEIIKEAKENPGFAERLERALDVTPKPPKQPGQSHRRTPAILEPFEEFGKGEGVLRERLAGLNIEQLRDIVAQYGMDRSKLAMKWKDTARLIEWIVTTVVARSKKGDAFRAPPHGEVGRPTSETLQPLPPTDSGAKPTGEG